MNYTKFNELVDDINSIVTQKVEIVNHVGGRHVGIKFVDKPVPISINESEYNFMHHTIVNNNLKVGYDTHTFTKKSFELVEDVLKLKMEKIYNYFENTDHSSVRHFPLGIINNLN